MFQSGIISTSDKLLKESKSTQRRGPTSGSNSSKGWAMGQVQRREEKKSYVQPNTAWARPAPKRLRCPPTMTNNMSVPDGPLCALTAILCTGSNWIDVNFVPRIAPAMGVAFGNSTIENPASLCNPHHPPVINARVQVQCAIVRGASGISRSHPTELVGRLILGGAAQPRATQFRIN
jgi:hypothetical protein